MSTYLVRIRVRVRVRVRVRARVRVRVSLLEHVLYSVGERVQRAHLGRQLRVDLVRVRVRVRVGVRVRVRARARARVRVRVRVSSPHRHELCVGYHLGGEEARCGAR